jgi:hypothetical protein
MRRQLHPDFDDRAQILGAHRAERPQANILPCIHRDNRKYFCSFVGFLNIPSTRCRDNDSEPADLQALRLTLIAALISKHGHYRLCHGIRLPLTYGIAQEVSQKGFTEARVASVRTFKPSSLIPRTEYIFSLVWFKF